jgi:hypothetical protein
VRREVRERIKTFDPGGGFVFARSTISRHARRWRTYWRCSRPCVNPDAIPCEHERDALEGPVKKRRIRLTISYMLYYCGWGPERLAPFHCNQEVHSCSLTKSRPS